MFRRVLIQVPRRSAVLLLVLTVAPPAWSQHVGSHGGHGGFAGHGYGGGHGFGSHHGSGHSYGLHGGLHGYSHYGYGHRGYAHAFRLNDYRIHSHGHSGYLHDYRHHDYDSHSLNHHYSYGYHAYPHYYWHARFGVGLYPWYAFYGRDHDDRPMLHTRGRIEVDDRTDAALRESTAVPPSIVTAQGAAYQRRAEIAFREGRFNDALRLANHALVEMPRNGRLLLFVAQAMFAMGDYQGAAAAIHQAAVLLDQDDWGYVVKNWRDYYRGSSYKVAMDKLNQFIKGHPDAAYARFLRAYHFGFLGRREFARKEMTKAISLESRDRLAAELLELFGGESTRSTQTENKGTSVDRSPPTNQPVMKSASGNDQDGHVHAGHNAAESGSGVKK